MQARLLLVLVVLALAGCAAGPQKSSSSGSAHRVRCLYDPSERDTRPLIFLLCIENP
jgi:hypothetical protein